MTDKTRQILFDILSKNIKQCQTEEEKMQVLRKSVNELKEFLLEKFPKYQEMGSEKLYDILLDVAAEELSKL